jgi:hypothetical protein
LWQVSVETLSRGSASGVGMTSWGYTPAMEKMGCAPTAFGRFFRNSGTGKLAIVQLPNIPLAIFIVATLVRSAFHPHGAGGTALSVIGAVSLAWWSVDEIARGDSPFRRILGAAVLVGLVLSLLTG